MDDAGDEREVPCDADIFKAVHSYTKTFGLVRHQVCTTPYPACPASIRHTGFL